ncbi:MAG TPA: AEC family transporter [Tepidisphaeraceae bacterium]|jgi:hypothetical protein|nr:AEC family transporter [Tepidisphaeraceae bacterium]
MFTSILLDVFAPIMLIIGLGVLVRRKFTLDINTLSKLNIYFLVPAFIFHYVSTSTLPWSDMGGIVLVTMLQCMTLGLVVVGIGRLLHISRPTLAAIALATMFYNSGNYGLPLAELAYPGRGTVGNGAAVQAFVLMTMNLLNFTVGLWIAAAAKPVSLWTNVKRIVRLPMLPALAGGMLCKLYLDGDASRTLPIVIAKPAAYIAGALVPVALFTLGAQLAARPRWPRWRPVGMVLFLRLIFGPIQMAALLYALHRTGYRSVDLWGENAWPAELLILTAAVPTAVNTLLMTLELDGDADLAADCVFWTTVFSCVTLPVWLLVIRSVF